MENEISIEISKTCRTCLSRNEKLLPLTSTIDHESYNIIDYFNKYLQFDYLDLENDNYMPQNICLRCFDRLLEVRKFSIQCQESENYLRVKLSLTAPKKLIDNNKIKIEILDEQTDCVDIEDSYTHIEVLDDDFIEFGKSDSDNLIVEKVENYEDSEIIDNDLEFTSNSDSPLTENNDDNEELLKSINKDKENSDNIQYQCEHCNLTFSVLKTYTRHISTHKTSKLNNTNKILPKLKRSTQNDSCLCPKCGRDFPTKKKMQTHLYKHNSTEFICKKCGKVYHHYGSFKEHDFMHQGIKPYKCNFCDKEFRQRTAYIIHTKLHTGKDIECKICDKKFAVQSQLRIHMTYHTNDLKFVCDICPKRYRKNNLLQMHKATHSDKKTVKCEYCDSYFYTKDALRTHKNSVHFRKYYCNLCPRRLPNPSDLKKHFLNNHGVSIEDPSPYKKKLSEITLLMTKLKNEEESDTEN